MKRGFYGQKVHDPGKWAEEQVENWLKKMSKGPGLQWHRYVDSRAAQALVAKQPADYLVTKRETPFTWQEFTYGKVTHLEVKDTAEQYRLPKGMLSQYGKLKLFALAGIAVRVLVHRKAHSDWVFFTEAELFAHAECPASWPFEGRRPFPTAAAALDHIFFY